MLYAERCNLTHRSPSHMERQSFPFSHQLHSQQRLWRVINHRPPPGRRKIPVNTCELSGTVCRRSTMEPESFVIQFRTGPTYNNAMLCFILSHRTKVECDHWLTPINTGLPFLVFHYNTARRNFRWLRENCTSILLHQGNWKDIMIMGWTRSDEDSRVDILLSRRRMVQCSRVIKVASGLMNLKV